jgi:hypothetical protein
MPWAHPRPMKANFFGLLFIALAFVLPVAISGEDGSAILAHHRAFVGWQADDNTVQSLKLTYSVGRRATPAPSAPPASASPTIDPPARRTSLTEYRRGIVYRDVYATGTNLTTEYGYTGKRFWRSDESKNTVSVLELDARERLTQDVIDAEGAALVPSVLVGTGQVGSVIADIVRITPPDGVPADLYVDRVTGAYLREVINPLDKLESESVDILSYKEIAPGKKLPAVTRGTTRGAEVRLESAELNPTFDPSFLLPPKSDMSWTFGSNDPTPITVAESTSVVGGARSVQFRATINGHEGTFLFDSGAASILLFTPFADTVGLETLGSTSYSGVNGGSVGAKLARVKDLGIGANVLHNVVVSISSTNLRGIDGIMGFPLLASAIVDVDLGGKSMTILDPVKFEPTIAKGAFAFPLDLSTFHAGIVISFPKNVIAHPVFDSGASFNVVLSSDLYHTGKVTGTLDPLNVLGYEVPEYQVGVDGMSTEKNICIRTSMRVGPFPYEAARTCFAPANVFGHDGGLIGFDFMRHFNWTFDYPESKFVLTPNGNK